MTTILPDIIIMAVVGGIGLGVGFVLNGVIQRTRFASQRRKAEDELLHLTQSAEREAEHIVKEAKIEAKDLVFQAKAQLEKTEKEKRSELQSLEKRMGQREEGLERKISNFERREEEFRKRERAVSDREGSLAKQERVCEQTIREHREALERVAGLTTEEGKRQLLAGIESEVRLEATGLTKRILDEARENAEREAQQIVTNAIQRITRDYVNEATISVVSLASDGMKGRIIGREGRNIRALEAATGVDLIVDETPEAVIVSGFDPLRREIAKISLERLMQDGRIHPTRIEEVVEKVKGDLEKVMREEAEKVIFEVGLSDFHPEIVKLLGRLRYRTSYGQNNLYHAREASYICGIMAAELGLDIKLAKRGALLHDIGKVVSHEEEGTHAMLGAEIAKKYGESEKIVNAIAAHHEQVDPICPESVLVAAAEALSAARPGARRETLEAYVKRLEKLEGLAVGYDGVDKAYAIQAGREVRVIVRQEKLSDNEALVLSRDLSKKIEQEMTYPGQIKVTVIRESRFVEFAK
ncbi:MAG: ribonuclease Y [Nitrospira sp.]|nr:ribonuclease Y [Nitrospira sp.]MDE0406208.1 ribonuclease Y [Nitrospira sp.]MDE0485977.1 ribonuclease Y [Nitrospira sp.]